MNYLIYGNESYLINQEIKKIEQKFKQPVITSLNASDPKFSFENLFMQASTIDFFNSAKIFIINNCNFLRSKGKLDDKNLPIIEHYLKDSFEDTTLIFVLNLENDEKIDSRKKIYKLFTKYLEVKNFSSLKQNDFITYVNSKLISSGINIDEAARQELLKRLPNDLSNFHHELDKLILYNDKITKELIVKMISPLYDENIFSLINGITSKNSLMAIKALNDLLKSKQDPIALVYSIAAQFRFIYKVKYLMNQDYTKQMIVDELRQNPYYIENTMKGCRRIHIDKILEILNDLSILDQRFKSITNINRELELELFVLKELDICNH